MFDMKQHLPRKTPLGRGARQYSLGVTIKNGPDVSISPIRDSPLFDDTRIPVHYHAGVVWGGHVDTA